MLGSGPGLPYAGGVSDAKHPWAPHLVGLDELFDLTEDLMHRVSPDGRVLWANRAWREALGYAKDELAALRVEDFVAPESLPGCREVRKRLIEGAPITRLEAVLLARGGARIRVDGRIQGDSEASPRWVQGVFRVVDLEQKRFRDLQHFLDISLDLLCIATVDGYYRVLNPAWKASLGYELEELVGRPFMDYVHPEDVEATAEALGALARGEAVIDFENRYRHRDGSWRNFLWTAAPDPDPESDQVYAAARDVTDLRTAQAAVEEREARQRALIDGSVDGILSLDVRGRIASANPAAARILGCEVGQLLEGAVGDFLVEPHRSEFSDLLAWVRDGDADAELGRTKQVVGVGVDGRQVPLEWTVSELPGDREQPLMVTFRDISERVAVERIKTEFVSTVSHELRTPLTSIRGSLRLLEGGVVGELPPEALDLARVAHANCLRLTHLIDDILDLEKLEAGHMRLALEPVDVAALVTDAVDRMGGFAAEHGVLLRDPEVGGLELVCDPERIEQVLANLLSNAVKFSPDGGEVSTRVHQLGDVVRFEVRDQGPGVPVEERDRIFGRFQQVDATDRRRRGGTGLGLAIGRALVRAHGGRVGVDAPAEGGSTFWFEVPRR